MSGPRRCFDVQRRIATAQSLSAAEPSRSLGRPFETRATTRSESRLAVAAGSDSSSPDLDLISPERRMDLSSGAPPSRRCSPSLAHLSPTTQTSCRRLLEAQVTISNGAAGVEFSPLTVVVAVRSSSTRRVVPDLSSSPHRCASR